jgi:hypothetical protein
MSVLPRGVLHAYAHLDLKESLMRSLLSSLITSAKARREATSFQRDWDRARREAQSPSHRAEIDAIFARHAG